MDNKVTFLSGDGVWTVPHGAENPEYGLVVKVVTEPGILLVTTADEHVSYDVLLPSGLRNIQAHRVFTTYEAALEWAGKQLPHLCAEEKMEKRITQHLVDNAFSCLDGFGRLTYALDGCRLIQCFIREAHSVHLSLSECQRFWKWRSNLWDASFLGVQDTEASRNEVLDFFNQWLDEMDLWEWSEEE